MKKNFKKSEFKEWFDLELSKVLENGERQEIFFRLLEHHYIGRLDWATINEIEIDEAIWNGYIADLKNQKPVQYILGYEYFAGEKYSVNEHVLIPRPETEELVNWIAEEFDRKKDLEILEVGTGSGCIAISLSKKILGSNFTATDISTGALEVAHTNMNAIGGVVQFVQDDILNTNLSQKKYDIIVSNPPYIPQEEADLINDRVKKFEPNIALFTEEKKPLQFYHAILEFGKEYLNNAGFIYFEMHEDYSQELSLLVAELGFQSIIKRDFYGKERMMRIKKGEH